MEKEMVFLHMSLNDLKALAKLVAFQLQVMQNSLKTPAADLLAASEFLGYDTTEIEEGPDEPAVVMYARFHDQVSYLTRIQAAIIHQHNYLYDGKGNVI